MVRQIQHGLKPGLELGQHIYARRRPPELVRLDAGPLAARVRAQVAFLVPEWRQGLGLAVRPGDLAVTGADVEDGAGDHEAGIDTPFREIFGEHRLVREGVRLIAGQVVEGEQLVIKETGRAGARHHVPGPDALDVAQGAVQAVGPFGGPERALGRRRQLVGPRPPDRPGKLQEMRVKRAEREQLLKVDGPRVILVQHGRGAVTDGQRRISQRAVRRGLQRLDHQPQAANLHGFPVRHGEESREAQELQPFAQVRHREVGQQHGRGMRHVIAQQDRVEMVLMQMRHIQVIGLPETSPVQPAVVREDEPRIEVARVRPRIAQDAPVRGVNPQPGMAQVGNLHPSPQIIEA